MLGMPPPFSLHVVRHIFASSLDSVLPGGECLDDISEDEPQTAGFLSLQTTAAKMWPENEGSQSAIGNSCSQQLNSVFFTAMPPLLFLPLYRRVS